MRLFSSLKLALVLVAITATGALANDLTIQFAKMKPGTRMYYKHSDGESWVEVYKGIKGKHHLIERYKSTRTSGRPVRMMYFDSAGREVFYRGFGSRVNPYKLTYVPYNCTYVAGKCKQVERFSGQGYVFSGQAETWLAETRQIKGGWATTWQRPNKDGAAVYRFELGPYNLRKTTQWLTKSGLKTVSLVKVE